ncbi:MAG: hypothetical protein HQ567_07035 [Candidatus Nealsonbacteria bacterium]|nr:hypothetical protein [Candidatus Nealsonbacteria bacterium]
MLGLRLPNRVRLWVQLLAGVGYLALVAVGVTAATEHHFLIVFVGVVLGAVFCSGLALLWLTLWALRDDGRVGQFGLGSLFFLTGFVSIYFAMVRWLVVSLQQNWASQGSAIELFLVVSGICLLLSLLAIPFVLLMTESLIWFAVWLVHRPVVRRWLRARRNPGR